MKRHPLFRSIWALVNLLLVASALYLLYAFCWEYSTRQYLEGFSDAVVPANAPPEEKVQAILDWMKSGPVRRDGLVIGVMPLRDPEETLNYRSLLRVCGSATNAFVNLGFSSGLEVRRLLLLNAQGSTSHVDAQVLLDGRWIVVDPTFRIILRGSHGAFLTRQQLENPQVFQFATAGLANYQPYYSFAQTAHLHLARFKFVGPVFGTIWTALFPGWDASPFMTLLVERTSFAACALAAVLFVFFLSLRSVLGWYAAAQLGVQRVRLRERLRRGGAAFLRQPS